MAGKEQAHVAGQTGVANLKRWLEATTRFDVPFTTYEAEERMTLKLLDGSLKTYDLYATHHNDDAARSYSGRVLYVESKNLTTPGKQNSDFPAFVATSYSVLHREWKDKDFDPKWEFMFATTHPWVISDFLKVTDAPSIAMACEKHTALLGGQKIDQEIVAALAERLWVWIIPKRQEEMTMGMIHLGIIRDAVTRATK